MRNNLIVECKFNMGLETIPLLGECFQAPLLPHHHHSPMDYLVTVHLLPQRCQ